MSTKESVAILEAGRARFAATGVSLAWFFSRPPAWPQASETNQPAPTRQVPRAQQAPQTAPTLRLTGHNLLSDHHVEIQRSYGASIPLRSNAAPTPKLRGNSNCGMRGIEYRNQNAMAATKSSVGDSPGNRSSRAFTIGGYRSFGAAFPGRCTEDFGAQQRLDRVSGEGCLSISFRAICGLALGGLQRRRHLAHVLRGRRGILSAARWTSA